jgi:chloramphenicol 3-O-phosphotransferase
MTDEECDLIEEKADAIGEVLSETPSHIVLHALMRIVADVGVQAKDKMTKREFVADCVECLDFWYDVWEKEDE